jgi:hypothetical protein
VFAFALLAGAMTTLSACGVNISEGQFLPNKGQLFASQDWASAGKAVPDFVSSRPVSAEDMVDAAGRCTGGALAETAAGTVAGDLGTGTAPAAAEQGVTPGGVGLGMTECQVVAHAGQPGQVDVGADEKGERKVVLTYLSGPWPGIYTFSAGRLKVVDRVAQPEQPKPARKRGKSPRPATAQR